MSTSNGSDGENNELLPEWGEQRRLELIQYLLTVYWCLTSRTATELKCAGGMHAAWCALGELQIALEEYVEWQAEQQLK